MQWLSCALFVIFFVEVVYADQKPEFFRSTAEHANAQKNCRRPRSQKNGKNSLAILTSAHDVARFLMGRGKPVVAAFIANRNNRETNRIRESMIECAKLFGSRVDFFLIDIHAPDMAQFRDRFSAQLGFEVIPVPLHLFFYDGQLLLPLEPALLSEQALRLKIAEHFGIDAR